jgi:uroporphyrinogen decarboxylase
LNKREILLALIDGAGPKGYVPAAFFMHFDPSYHRGQAAIDKHMQFCQYTGMDFVKVQYEQALPPSPTLRQPGDWAHAPRLPEAFFEESIRVVEGLVKAAKSEALVIMTLYSPLMWAAHYAGDAQLAGHWRENPDAVKQGLEIMTENVLTLARGCMRVGVDGFYASTQGGESFRFPGSDFFQDYVRPTDLVIWDEIGSCAFNILHICDYAGGYASLTPFLDYPGHVVNCSLKLGERSLTPVEVSHMFARPYMGGMERKGVIASGDHQQIRQAAQAVLAASPERFILAADCTVPSKTPWDNLKTAIEEAHKVRF